MATNRFMELRKKAEVLEKLDKELDVIARDYLCDYKIVKEIVTNEQDVSWRTGELIWEDDEKTIPKMRVDREWDYVPRPEEELTDEDRALQKAVEDVRKLLLKLV